VETHGTGCVVLRRPRHKVARWVSCLLRKRVEHTPLAPLESGGAHESWSLEGEVQLSWYLYLIRYCGMVLGVTRCVEVAGAAATWLRGPWTRPDARWRGGQWPRRGAGQPKICAAGRLASSASCRGEAVMDRSVPFFPAPIQPPCKKLTRTSMAGPFSPLAIMTQGAPFVPGPSAWPSGSGRRRWYEDLRGTGHEKVA